MKKIINGKRYDTDTAKRVAIWEHSNRRDFNFVSEQLYRKTTGEYFLYGEGGAASKYAESLGQNTWGGGEKIIPLSFEAAQAWAEKHLDGEEYEAIFGAITEDASKKNVCLSLPVDKIEIAKRRASEAGMTISDYIASLIN